MFSVASRRRHMPGMRAPRYHCVPDCQDVFRVAATPRGVRTRPWPRMTGRNKVCGCLGCPTHTPRPRASCVVWKVVHARRIPGEREWPVRENYSVYMLWPVCRRQKLGLVPRSRPGALYAPAGILNVYDTGPELRTAPPQAARRGTRLCALLLLVRLHRPLSG